MQTLSAHSILALTLLLFASCSPKDKVEYQEQSPEETAQATKAVFSEANINDEFTSYPLIEDFFARHSMASRSNAPIDVHQFISISAMMQSMDSAGMLDSLNFLERAQFKKGLSQGLQRFDQSIKQMAYDEFRILRVETIDDDERLVYIRHYDNELNITMQLRWWLISTEDGPRIYDFEELSIGLRTMSLMGTMMKEALSKDPAAWVQDLVNVTQLMQTIDLTSEEGQLALEAPTLKLRQHSLPQDIQRFASVIYTGVLQVKGEITASLEELEASKAGGYDSPIYHYLRANSYMGAEDYTSTLKELEIHAALLGWDSDVLELKSDCYWQLGDPQAARSAALQGLQDNPNSINCLASLAIASSEEELTSTETTTLFAACNAPEYGYEVSLDYLIDSNEIKKAQVLFDTFKRAHPKSELISYYEDILP